jgi:DNA-directed RNA polymerase
MTSVYGVTFIGAREQIANRLKERKDIAWPEPIEQVRFLCIYFISQRIKFTFIEITI